MRLSAADELGNGDEPDEAAGMLAAHREATAAGMEDDKDDDDDDDDEELARRRRIIAGSGAASVSAAAAINGAVGCGRGIGDGLDGGGLANGSSGHNTLGEQARAHSSSPRRIPLFERASARWWNPQFASPTLETQYWKCSFPLLRDRFRSGLIYILMTILLWMTYFHIFDHDNLHHWVATFVLSTFFILILLFTLSLHYQRFYLPTSFFCTFLICMITLLIFSGTDPYMGPIASMATSIQVVLLIYTVIPLPLYLCILISVSYSFLFELLMNARAKDYMVRSGVKLALHGCVHLLGVHLFILTQVRQRKTFLKVGQSLLARKDLELETQFKDHMIQSVMPKKVADELLKETSELRRPSQSLESNCRTSNSTTAGRSSAAESTVGIVGGGGGGGAALIGGPPSAANEPRSSNQSVPNVRKFRPFTMNMMSNVSILFADIAGFTRMSSNKSADELVNLLNDLFGRFDYLCGRCNLEKISTLGDCYYCVAGCPEPRADHAKCCVEMGLAMIIAIKQFDMDRGQMVNMRVGIHTGKVMCGMVGTKRFKFDVFSNDVTLANEMESTGVAGRVHISEVTAKYLNNQYLLEEAPDHKGLKTYFIAGRSKELESASNRLAGTASDSDSAVGGVGVVSGSAAFLHADSGGASSASATGGCPGNGSNAQKLSFRKKLAGKLKTIQSASLPLSRATTNSMSGGGGGVGVGVDTELRSGSHLKDGSGLHQHHYHHQGPGGSLRMKLLERSGKAQTCSAQILNGAGIDDYENTGRIVSASEFTAVDEAKRHKSSSMQALGAHPSAGIGNTNGGLVTADCSSPLPPLAHATTSYSSAATPPPASAPAAIVAEPHRSWTIAERIGGKISIDLANGSSANNSGRGSRSSGLQDAGSEVHSVGGLDTAISHHHNAASLTRFDTENRDFDQRLAQVIHNTDGTLAKNFWMHQDSLNRWTLNFNQKDIEDEYRAHFAESSDRQSYPKSGLAKHHQLERNKMEEQRRRRQPRYRYSGVFIDIIVSAVIFAVTATILFIGVNPPRSAAAAAQVAPSVAFIVYCAAAGAFLLAVVGLIGVPLLTRKRGHKTSVTSNVAHNGQTGAAADALLPLSFNQWTPRHVLGCLLIALPVFAALFNVPTCTQIDPPSMLCVPSLAINRRLLYGYVFLIAVYGHCNFSQLGAWPKTALAMLTACIFLFTTWLCQNNLDYVLKFDAMAGDQADGVLRDDYADPFPFSTAFNAAAAVSDATDGGDNVVAMDAGGPLLKCNRTQPRWAGGHFGSPIFIWELVVDTLLAVILVAFLNYQFETAFRMSFYGDVQARRDTAKMQLVRDQADWLLTNIIPQHAVESLKTNTKYSENHNLTAVMFASITNWNEMYEENFEGGREFLRVLNEVFGDFDELLDRPDFCHVEKIKTIGSTYMAASGLNPERRRLSLHPYEHLYQLMEFALALQNALAFFNQDLLNFEFVCKIGLNIGPVTAGVIGTTKLYYDIWGDTVNIASRMYSTGVENRIQVSQYTRDLLIDRYDFEYRDHIEVKGVDGGMDTYLYVPKPSDTENVVSSDQY